MKWFYIISFAVAAALALSPFALLPKTGSDTATVTIMTPKSGPSSATADSAPAFDTITRPAVVSYTTYGAKIRSLDPATCGDTSSSGLQGAVFEGLYGYHFLKRPIEVIPLLAEAMPEVSPDGLTYTIRVKKGVYYCPNACFGRNADGTPQTRELTADDFVFAFKRIADYHISTPMSFAFVQDKIVGIEDFRAKTQVKARGDFSRYRDLLDGVKAVDRYTLQLKLATPWPQIIYVLALANFAPIPPEAVDYYLTTQDDGKGGRKPVPIDQRDAEIREYPAMVGTGPYYVDTFVDGGDIVLKRNPTFRKEYYPSEGTPEDAKAGLLADAGKQVPFIDAVKWQFVSEDYTLWALFMSKMVDMTGIPRQLFNKAINADKTLSDKLTKQGIILNITQSPAVYWLAFNMDDKLLGKSKALRQALCMGFNVEDYIEVLQNGRGIRATTYVPSSFEGHDEAVGPYAHFDLAAAKAKIAEARKELEAAGALAPGEPIQLTVDLGGRDEEERRMGEFIQKQFRQLGVETKIETNDWPTLQQKVENKLTQIYAMGWQADYPDPENFLQLYYSPNIKRGTNNTNYSNLEFDAMYEKASRMMPSPERTAIYVKMLKMLNENCPVLLLSEPISFGLAHDWMHNIKPHPFGYNMLKYRRLDAQQRRAEGGP